MTIKFICSCGKHLKARDEMAARRSICPRCGNPVGIPSLKPTHAGGGAAPLTPLERLRLARDRKPAPLEAVSPQPESTPNLKRPVDTHVVRLLSSRGQRRADLTGQQLEEHWYECLLYPLRAWRLCLGLALVLAVLSAGLAQLLPEVLTAGMDSSAALSALVFCWGLFLAAVIGLPCGFLECVLVSAVTGEIYYIRWSGNPLFTVLYSAAKWIVCFLAGPLVFAGTAYVYWLQCGEPARVDNLILAELGVVAIAYWLLALLAVTDRGWLRGLNPLGVIDLAHRMGWRTLVVLLAALVLLAHGWALLVGVAEVHESALLGCAMLAGGWTSGVFWSTFFCRLLGVWCHRRRAVAGSDDAPASERSQQQA